MILGPTAPTTAFEISANADDPVQMYLGDIFTIPAAFRAAGAFDPCGFDAEGLPVGLQLMGRLSGKLLLGAAHRYRQATDWHLRIPTGRRCDRRSSSASRRTRSSSRGARCSPGASTAFGAPPSTPSVRRRYRPSRRPAGAQPRGGRAYVPLRPRGERHHQPPLDLRAQELLLPRLPKGYQISQYENPIVQGGEIRIAVEGQKRRFASRVHISRKTLESLSTARRYLVS